MQITQTDKELQIEIVQLKKAALVYRAVNHVLRQQMLRLLHKNHRMPVTDIYVKLRIEQSVASQHLAILRRVGFVNAEREGKNIFYSVNYQRLNEVHQHAQEIIGS